MGLPLREWSNFWKEPGKRQITSVIQFLKGTWEETNYIRLWTCWLGKKSTLPVGSHSDLIWVVDARMRLGGLLGAHTLSNKKAFGHRFCQVLSTFRVVNFKSCSAAQHRAIRSYWSVRKSWETACCLHFKHPPGTCFFQILWMCGVQSIYEYLNPSSVSFQTDNFIQSKQCFILKHIPNRSFHSLYAPILSQFCIEKMAGR